MFGIGKSFRAGANEKSQTNSSDTYTFGIWYLHLTDRIGANINCPSQNRNQFWIQPKETTMQEVMNQNEMTIEIEELEAKIAPDGSANWMD